MRLICYLYFLFLLQNVTSAADNRIQTDICVLGGSEAGFTAAIQAARMGKSVVLIEPTGHPGGMMVEGIVKDIRFGSSVVIGGIAREVYTAIEDKYGKVPDFDALDWYSRYEPSVAEAVIESFLEQEEKIRIIRHARISESQGVVLQGKRIMHVVLDDGSVIEADFFIDASIEGDLLHLAGVPTETIREGNARYHETRNGIQTTNTYRQFAVNVDPYVIPGDPESGLIPTIQPGKLGTHGAPDKHIMGFCFRLCLTRDTANLIPIEQPDDYDPFTYEIYRRYMKAGGKLFAPRVNRMNGKTDLGSWHDLSANFYGENWPYPAGDYQTRDSIVQHHKDFTQGLIWFFQNDPDVSDETRRDWQGWGLCRDEFMDNGGWPRRLYVRSARRMVSEYVITEQHTYRDRNEETEDPVAIAWWPPDMHHARRIVHNGFAFNEGFVFGGNNWKPFGISFRALIPDKEYCTNLITPTCPSSSYVAYGAVRILPTFMILGQSVACAASLALNQQVHIQDIEYDDLRPILDSSDQILTIPDDWENRVDSENH